MFVSVCPIHVWKAVWYVTQYLFSGVKGFFHTEKNKRTVLCGPLGYFINWSTSSHSTNSLFPPNFCGSMVLKSISICKTEQESLGACFLPGSLSGVLGNKEKGQVIICSNKTVKFLTNIEVVWLKFHVGYKTS